MNINAINEIITTKDIDSRIINDLINCNNYGLISNIDANFIVFNNYRLTSIGAILTYNVNTKLYKFELSSNNIDKNSLLAFGKIPMQVMYTWPQFIKLLDLATKEDEMSSFVD